MSRFTTEMVVYLKVFAFKFAMTITSNPKPNRRQAITLISEIFSETETQSYFWVAEPHKQSGYHIHALFNNEDPAFVKKKAIKKSKGGRLDFGPIRDQEACLRYTLKNIENSKVSYRDHTMKLPELPDYDCSEWY